MTAQPDPLRSSAGPPLRGTGPARRPGARPDVRYVLEGLALFWDLRVDGERLLEGFSRRLLLENGSPDLTVSGSLPGRNPLAVLWDRIRAAARFLSLVPLFLRQHRQLAVPVAPSGSGPDTAIVAISSGRLRYREGETTPRRYLAALSKSFPGRPAEPSIADEIAAAGRVLIFDPLPFSRLWARARSSWNDRVFIVDEAYLCFLALRSPLKMLRVVRTCLAESRAVSGPRPGLLALLVCAIVVSGCESLLARAPETRGYLFTSNSIATEILRAWLLQEPRCRSVTELLHGVPTTEYDRYLATLIRLGAAHDAEHRHDFVPQVPDLPLYGAFQARRYVNGAAINPYVNQWLLERPQAQEDPRAFLRAGCEAVLPAGTPLDRALVVAFTGGTSHDAEYSTSRVFRIERLALTRIANDLKAQGRPYVILYTPHPAHLSSLLARSRFFSDMGITVRPDTIFTWLIADACVSLVSSALFESAWCGVPTFTPMTLKDDIYPAILLDQLHHPQPDEPGFLDPLSRFIAEQAARAPVDRLARAASRLRLLR